ncbi:unnamed protein product [Rotaria sordida]|nr:unnamed protein product [Rotaria sordida]
MTNRTSTISNHVKNWLNKLNKLKNNKTLDDFVSKSTEVNLTVDDKRFIAVVCAKFCSFDLRSFNIAKGSSFTSFCQSLLNLGHKYGAAKLGVPSANSLLPDPTNISRTVAQLAEEYQENLKGILKKDL